MSYSAEPVPVLAPGNRLWSRGPDRRSGLSTVLDDLARGLEDPRGVSLQARFEDSLRTLMSVRHLEIKEGLRGSAPSRASESLALEIPGGGPRERAVLEVTFDPSCGLDDWDLQVLHAATRLAALVLEIERTRHGPFVVRHAPRQATPPLIGSSAVMQALRERIDRVAATDFTVLVEGESGSGKELVARQIHDRSRRRRGPCVAVNCAALVETLLEAELFGIEDRTATGVRGRRGKFEHADGGTLFLDEVSDLSPAAQAKLLRAIQDLAIERVGGHATHRVNTRLVVATNRSLGALVGRGEFRADLYYRLSGIEVFVSPLRERREDILELADYFLDQHAGRYRFELSPAAADALVAYDWPGNVRELQRVLERAVALARTRRIELDDLPPIVTGRYAEALLPSVTSGHTLREWASRYARLVLGRCHNNKRQACRVLGISYHTLRAHLRYRPRAQVAKRLESAGRPGDGVARAEGKAAVS